MIIRLTIGILGLFLSMSAFGQEPQLEEVASDSIIVCTLNGYTYRTAAECEEKIDTDCTEIYKVKPYKKYCDTFLKSIPVGKCQYQMTLEKCKTFRTRERTN